MDILVLFHLQASLFLMILLGALAKKLGFISEEGKTCLTDLCINIILPCNIIKSCMMEFNMEILRMCGLLLVVAAIIQVMYVLLNKILFRSCDEKRRKVLQYGILVSNGGFLGNPVAEGVYGPLGLLYASVFLIPVRIVMWSVGTSYFVAESVDKKKVIRNIFTHPCLVAVYLGMLLMIIQIQLPEFLVTTITHVGNCNTAITMFIIGTIILDVKWTEAFDRMTGIYCVLRLVLLPAAAVVISWLFGLEGPAAGVAIIITGMPAAATTAIFASRYDSDAPFAAKCVVLSTLVSMVTIPVWCYLIG